MPEGLFQSCSFYKAIKENCSMVTWKEQKPRSRQRFRFWLDHTLAVWPWQAVFPLSVKWGQSHLLTGLLTGGCSTLFGAWHREWVSVRGTSGCHHRMVPLGSSVCSHSSCPPLSMDSEGRASHSSDFPGLFILMQVAHSTVRLFTQWY